MSAALAVALALLAGKAAAESLGEAAQRERERRTKNREAGVSAPVIGPDELAAATPGRGTLTVLSPTASAPTTPARSSEIDARRTAARRRVDSQYKKAAPVVERLLDDAHSYDECVRSGRKATKCSALYEGLLRAASKLSRLADDVETDARAGWLTPGELREARARQGISEGSWDTALRLAARHR